MIDENNIALFDAFLRDEMSSTEKDDFKLHLSQNPAVEKEFDAYVALSNDIKNGEEYRQIKEKLENIHKTVIPSSKPLILRPRFWVPLAVAAAVTVLVLIIPITNNVGTSVADNNADYHPLINDGDDEDDAAATEEEVVMCEEVFENDSADILSGPIHKELSYIHKQPKGTCFLISQNGYFLTNKHLVRKKQFVRLQQHDLNVSFNAAVVYRDTLLDFAILKCSEENADKLKAVPFRFYQKTPSIGDEVFTLGYPKSDIVYTKGDVSSETGFRSDSLSYEISMPSNPGNSGAPLFNKRGDLIGLIMANNSRKQSVTYIIKHDYIQDRLSTLKDSLDIDMSRNYTKRYSNRSDQIKKYRSFIFELH
jgi:S1-C subfamily serine protease